MEKAIVYGLILLICLTGTFINAIGKLLLKKTCLQNGKTVRAQVVSFEEIIFLKNTQGFAILNYMENGEKKNCFLWREKQDKLNDYIYIITDGNMAIRLMSGNIVRNYFENFLCFLVFTILISLTDVDNSIFILIVLFVIMLLIIGLYPFLYRICYEYVGKQLGY